MEKDSEMKEIEGKLNEALGTRVMIERKEVGGKVVIDFFNNDDLHHLLQILEGQTKMQGFSQKLKSELAKVEGEKLTSVSEDTTEKKWTVENLVTAPNSEYMQNQRAVEGEKNEQMIQDLIQSDSDLGVSESGAPIDDSSPADKVEDDEDLYSIKNFSL